MKIFREMFSGRDGKVSNMRIQSSFWTAGILFCIIWIVLHTNTFPNIPDAVVLSVPAVMCAKAYQAKNENATKPVG
jgi:hypothetical protein